LPPSSGPRATWRSAIAVRVNVRGESDSDFGIESLNKPYGAGLTLDLKCRPAQAATRTARHDYAGGADQLNRLLNTIGRKNTAKDTRK
jgi:hypothetical protein